MRTMLVVLLAGVGAAGLLGQSRSVQVPETESFVAGGVPFVLPPPTPEFAEVGNGSRKALELLVPSSNRLVAGYVLARDLPSFIKGTNPRLTTYALVEVLRKTEDVVCRPADFKQFVADVQRQFGHQLDAVTKRGEDEVNRRIKALDLKNASVRIGKPIQLGDLFSTEDAYGFGALVPISVGEKPMAMIGGTVAVRAKQRLLFAYLYTEYKDDETVTWLRESTKKWAGALLASNR